MPYWLINIFYVIPVRFNATHLLFIVENMYRNVPKFSDRYAWANNADPDQTAPDQGLHCLLFRLHRLDSLPYGRAI